MEALASTDDPRARRVVESLSRGWKGREISDVIDDSGHQYVDLVMEGGGVIGIAVLTSFIRSRPGVRA